jgi:hypothetical protein
MTILIIMHHKYLPAIHSLWIRLKSPGLGVLYILDNFKSMKTIYNIYEASILGDVDDVLAKGDTDIAEVMVMDIINAVYRIKKSTKLEIIPVKNENGKYTVNAVGDVEVKDRKINTLVNDVFE